MTSTTSSLLAEKLKRLNSNDPQEMAETLRAFWSSSGPTICKTPAIYKSLRHQPVG
jgi:hypothetical protein